jgi:hypothetical protein
MGGSLMTNQPEQIREDALTIVRNALKWEVPPQRWTEIAAVLADLEAALDAGDLDAVAKATIQLELAAPVRITKIKAPVQPPPPPVRERLNVTVGRLSGKSESEDDGE